MVWTRGYERPLAWGILILSFLAGQPLPGGEEPEELTVLREKYVDRVHEVQKAVTKRHILALAEIQASLNQSGKTDEALVVLQERKKLAAFFLRPAVEPGIRRGEPSAAPNPSPQRNAAGGFDPVGTTWSWRRPAKEITFLKNGRAYVLFPELGEKPLPHFWKKVGLREIEVRYENGIVTLTFEVNKNGRSGIVKSGESNAVAEVFLIAGKADKHN